MITCSQCQQSNPGGARFCEGCGAALEDPQAAERAADVIEADFMLTQTKRAGAMLLLVAILGSIGGLVETAMAHESERLVIGIINGVLWGSFFGLWLWSRRRPLAAGITGLTLYLLIVLLAAAGDPSTIVRGIIFKVIIIGGLAQAISAGFKHRTFVRQRGLG